MTAPNRPDHPAHLHSLQKAADVVWIINEAGWTLNGIRALCDSWLSMGDHMDPEARSYIAEELRLAADVYDPGTDTEWGDVHEELQ